MTLILNGIESSEDFTLILKFIYELILNGIERTYVTSLSLSKSSMLILNGIERYRFHLWVTSATV